MSDLRLAIRSLSKTPGFLAVTIPVVTTAMGAATVPAWRARAVSPLTALRSE